jgi:hypothetical protein
MRRRGRCYRCIYTWTIRHRRNPKVCPRCKSRLWSVPKFRPVVLGNGLGIDDVLGPHRIEIRRVAKKNGATRLWVFGSVRRQEARPDSDVDLLVKWRRPVSLLAHVHLAGEIERILGRKVDLANWGGLHWAIEPQVEREALPI